MNAQAPPSKTSEAPAHPLLSDWAINRKLEKLEEDYRKPALTSGKSTSILPHRGIPENPGAGFTLLDLSPTADGKRIAFVRKTDQSDVYIGNLEANGFRLNSTRRLTLDDRMDWPAGWLRDGKTVLFFSNRSGHFDIFQ
jgi:hypothetical protein